MGEPVNDDRDRLPPVHARGTWRYALTCLAPGTNIPAHVRRRGYGVKGAWCQPRRDGTRVGCSARRERALPGTIVKQIAPVFGEPMHYDWNDRARKFLERNDFSCEPEPDSVIQGRVPDFFCIGAANLWIEVKALLPTADEEHLFRIFDYLRGNAHKVKGTGRGIAFISSQATEKDAKVGLSLANRALADPKFKTNNRTFALIPVKPDYGQTFHFTIREKKGTAWFLGCRSTRGEYGYPYTIAPDPWRQSIRLTSGDGRREAVKLDDFAQEDRYRLALELLRNGKPFTMLAAGRAGGAFYLTNVQRIRDAVSDANSQFKNALDYRMAPTALFIYQTGPLVADDRAILSALFGDLQYTFQPKHFQECELTFGRNASWNLNQHTSTSAITYFPNEGTPVTVHNPWALTALPQKLFAGREWIPLADGKLKLTE